MIDSMTSSCQVPAACSRRAVYDASTLLGLRFSTAARRIARPLRKKFFCLRIWNPSNRHRSHGTQSRPVGTRWVSPSTSHLPSLLVSNVRSLDNKLPEVNTTVLKESPDIALFTESWLHDGIDDDAISINGYSVARNDRTHKRGGGIIAYVRCNIPFRVIVIYMEVLIFCVSCPLLWHYYVI